MRFFSTVGNLAKLAVFVLVLSLAGFAQVTLRNALDDCSVDLPRDLGASAGPLGPLVARAAAFVRDRALSHGGAAWS